MKVDLHLHTYVSAKNGDSINWVDSKSAITTLHNNRVKAAAFTDHSDFDAKLYIESRDFASTGDISMFPGVEMNVRRFDDKIAHLLLIFDNNLSNEQVEHLEYEIKANCKKRGVSISTINNLFKDYETIRIPHVGKSDYFSIDDLKILKWDAFESSSLLNPNYIKAAKEFKHSVVAFSDTHIWKDYPQQKKLYTDMNCVSFHGIKELLKLNKNYTKEAF